MRNIFIIIALAHAMGAHAQPTYSKSTEFTALRVSYAAIQSVLDKASSLASSANGGASPEREELTLRARELRISISGHNLLTSPAKIPDQIDQLSYSIIGASAARIAQVEMDFSGYRRSLTIRGSSADQVDALFAALSSDLAAMSHPVGGSNIQSMLGFPLRWILGFLLGVMGWNWYATRSRGYAVVAIASLAALSLTVILPVDQLLAGFLAVRGDPSPLVRYGAEISFLGLLLAIVGIPAAMLPFLGRRRISVGAIPIVQAPSPSTAVNEPSQERTAEGPR